MVQKGGDLKGKLNGVPRGCAVRLGLEGQTAVLQRDGRGRGPFGRGGWAGPAGPRAGLVGSGRHWSGQGGATPPSALPSTPSGARPVGSGAPARSCRLSVFHPSGTIHQL